MTLALTLGVLSLLVIGSVLVLTYVYRTDMAIPLPEGFVKDGRRWKR